MLLSKRESLLFFLLLAAVVLSLSHAATQWRTAGEGGWSGASYDISFSPGRGSHLVVRNIAAGSPAASSGLLQGQRILAVNGVEKDQLQVLRSSRPGNTLVFRVQDRSGGARVARRGACRPDPPAG